MAHSHRTMSRTNFPFWQRRVHQYCNLQVTSWFCNKIIFQRFLSHVLIFTWSNTNTCFYNAIHTVIMVLLVICNTLRRTYNDQIPFVSGLVMGKLQESSSVSRLLYGAQPCSQPTITTSAFGKRFIFIL